MKKHSVRWTLAASHDLEEIIIYLAQSRPVTARKLYQRIKISCKKLNSSPERCRVVPELQRCSVLRYRELIVSPYRIMFRVDKREVFVVAVYDGRRDLEELLLRRLLRD